MVTSIISRPHANAPGVTSMRTYTLRGKKKTNQPWTLTAMILFLKTNHQQGKLLLQVDAIPF
jgi:hypothetical protein